MTTVRNIIVKIAMLKFKNTKGLYTALSTAANAVALVLQIWRCLTPCNGCNGYCKTTLWCGL